jgi:predicted protein tyrosine phosphatase
MTNKPDISLIITPLFCLSRAYSFYGSEYVISIANSDELCDLPTPEGVKTHKKFFFDDTDDPRDSLLIGPSKKDVSNIADLFSELPDPATSPVLIHCFAGISRSSATAYVLYCMAQGEGHEAEAMALTEASAPYGGIRPNRLLVAHADKILNREGKMIQALEDWYNKPKKELENKFFVH